MDLFMAGSETTSKALSFGFLYLMLFPQVQKKAQKEIDQVLGRDRFPTLDDRAKYTKIIYYFYFSTNKYLHKVLPRFYYPGCHMSKLSSWSR